MLVHRPSLPRTSLPSITGVVIPPGAHILFPSRTWPRSSASSPPAPQVHLHVGAATITLLAPMAPRHQREKETLRFSPPRSGQREGGVRRTTTDIGTCPFHQPVPLKFKIETCRDLGWKDGHNSSHVMRSCGETVGSLPSSRPKANVTTSTTTCLDPVVTPNPRLPWAPRPLVPPRPRARGTHSPSCLLCPVAFGQKDITTPLELVEELRPTLMRFRPRTLTLEVPLRTPGPSFWDVPSTRREVPSAEASLRVTKCEPAERPWSSELLVLGDEEPQLARPTVLWKNAMLTARCRRLLEKTSHYSVKECYPLCSCSDLGCVALAAVILFEQNNTVSSGFCSNTYQLSSCADSDRMTTLWMAMTTKFQQNSENPVGGMACHHLATALQAPKERLPALRRPIMMTTPHRPQQLSQSPMTREPTCCPRLAPAPPVCSSGRSPGLAATSLARRPSRHPSPSHHQVGPKGRLLTTLLRHLLLGLLVAPSVAATNCLTLGSLIGILQTYPVVMANRFALRNGYGTVEARYHLTAYDCSDPTEVQAYSSIPSSHCSVRATPVQKDQPTGFQLLQKEKKRYITAYSCFLFRTDIRYNCGAYGHPELDPMHWSFAVLQQ